MTSMASQLVCSSGCAFVVDVTEVIYRCPKCLGLLEVRHDESNWRSRSATDWKALFETRWGEARLPGGSGVWGKKEWVMPQLPADCIVSLGEGKTPLLPLPRLAKNLSLESLELKQCGVSPTGSFKDLGMTVLVSIVQWMRKLGKDIKAVACASTGDTSAALSAYCAAAGIPSVVLLPKGKVTPAQLIQPLANGSMVLSVKSDFDGCMKLVQEMSKDESLYLANSMNSIRLEGQKMVAVELAQQWNWEVPDWVIIPGGNLGNVTALGMGFNLLFELGLIHRKPRLAVAQSEKANPLYRSFQRGLAQLEPMEAQKTWASAIQIGNPVSFQRAVNTLRAFDGYVEQASESEMANAAAMADREGAYCCPHTGVALAVLQKACAAGAISRGSRVSVISTAHGLKFTEFKKAYHIENIEEFRVAHGNSPIEIEPNVSAIHQALDRRGA